MSGVVALLGGGEHTSGCEAVDRRLLRVSGVRTPEVAVLLGASPRRRRALKAAEARAWWAALGARARCAFAGEPDPVARARRLLAEADLVVLTGGRPWLLRRRLAGEVGDALRARWRDGVPVAGSSAGAMALGAWTWSLHPSAPFTPVPGLGFVPGVLVAPHAGRHGVDGRAERTQALHPHLEVLLVADRTAVLVDGDCRQVVGRGTARSLRGRALAPGPAPLVA